MNPEQAFDGFFEGLPSLEGSGDYGSGVFGQWMVDEAGFPAYAHSYQGPEDQWHLIGNDRIIATAHAEGYVQLYDWSRAGKVINRWDPAHGEYAGGFSFLHVNGQDFCTLRSRLPEGASQQRRFGMGYFEKETALAGLRIIERIEAPPGDGPVLLSTKRVKNESGARFTFHLTEFWAVNLHQITVAPILTHGLDRLVDRHRRRLKRRFTCITGWAPDNGRLQIEFAPYRRFLVPDVQRRAFSDWHPKPVFLVALDPPGNGEDFAVISDGDAFFGGEGLAHPPGARGLADGALLQYARASHARSILAMRRKVTLENGEAAAWRFGFGCAACEDQNSWLKGQRQADEKQPHQAQASLCAPEVPWLDRELRWHAYYLRAGAQFNDFIGAHFVDQGSAYAYLQGATGAPRDLALFAMPLVYLRPDLAKEQLRFMMRLQRAKDGGFPYALGGHGLASGLGVHSWSSDLDLFFFMALGEYLGATRDHTFLDEENHYYPPTAGRTGSVLDHVRASFTHLVERVGLGRHGLIRCGTGDWNDVLLAFSRIPPLTAWRGESALNAGMAAFVLPALAGLIDETDAELAEHMRRFAGAQRQALRQLWTGQWVARGYGGLGEEVLGRDRLFLDAQGPGVLGGIWSPEEAQTIFGHVQSLCVDPQAVGARCLWPPMRGLLLEPGSDTNGGTWAAIDAWTAWAWSKVDPGVSWRFFLSSTLAARAEAYPGVWYGVWSGPDAYNAHYHPRPGETFNLNATPMTLFPVMNMNRHAGPLLAAIKQAGIGFDAQGLVIAPRLPFDRFTLHLPLIGIAYLPGRHRGYYTPICEGIFRFAVQPPAGLTPDAVHLTINGEPGTFTRNDAGQICFNAAAAPGQRITWEIT